MSYGNRNLRGSRPATSFHSFLDAGFTLNLTNIDANKGYDLDTTGGAWTVNLPAVRAVSAGAAFSICYAAGANPVTINAAAGDTLLWFAGPVTVNLTTVRNAIRLVAVRDDANGDYWALDGGQIL